MNDQLILTDATIEAMLTRRAGPAAPEDLAAVIAADLRAMPEERRPWWSVLGPSADRGPAFRLAWIVAMTGLLLAATVSAMLVGSQVLRRSNELAVVPQPTVVPERTLVPEPMKPLTIAAHPEGVAALAWSPDGTHLATAGRPVDGDDGGVKVWDATAGEELLAFITGDWDRTEATLAYSPDGSRIAIGGPANAVYDAVTGEELVRLGDYFLAYSPDGSRIGTGGAWGYAAVVDAATGDELLGLPVAPAWLSAMEWSPDGTRVATTWGAGTKVRDAATGSEQLTLGSLYRVTAIAWSPDGTRIATASDEGATAKVYSAATGDELTALRRHDSRGVQAVAWSPDGTRIATAGSDGTARIWDASTGDQLAVLSDHAGMVTDVAWSPDGTRIATASVDGNVRIQALGQQPLPVPSPTATPTPRPSPSPKPTPATATVRIVGGADILATTKARPLPAQATCPPGSDPDVPGPADQEHPVNAMGAMAFDRHAGRIVVLATDDQPGRRTYTFDVCTNTWQRMDPPEEPLWDDPVRLVYDADSDRTLAFEADRVWSYDLAADRWTVEGRFASPIRGIAGWGAGDRTAAVYHEPSGQVIVFDGESMWAYDVETNSMTTVRQLPDVSPPTGSGLPEGVTAVAYDRDRDLLLAAAAAPDELRDSTFFREKSRPYWSWVETAVLEIWAFDPGTGRWRLMPSEVPAGVLWQDDGWFVGPANRVAFDEASGVTVYMSSGGWVEAFDGQRSWRAHPSAGGRCDSLDPVFDALNGRIVCRVSEGGVSAFSTVTGEWRWLVEPGP